MMFALVEIEIPATPRAVAQVLHVQVGWTSKQEAWESLIGSSRILNLMTADSYPPDHLRFNDRLYAVVETTDAFKETA